MHAKATTYVADSDFTLYLGDVRQVLAQLPAESVHCVVTSPPYWGLRDYGTGVWDGGDPDCDHAAGNDHRNVGFNERWGRPAGELQQETAREFQFKEVCGKCGARRVDQQLGLEATPDLYVQNMVDVFREVRRVLRRDGTCWLNIGSSFADKQDIGIPWKLAEALRSPYYTGRIRKEVDRVWLAAVVEAEGCLFIHKRKAGSDSGAQFTKADGTEMRYARTQDTYGSGLEVSSTDRVIVERCMEITGTGSICQQTPEQNQTRKQTIFRWNVRSNECKWIIRELYPHLLAKKHEARLLLGCPSSGEDARKAHESLKAIHQGQQPCIDFREPEGMWERGWFLRSEIIWAKLDRIPCRSR